MAATAPDIRTLHSPHRSRVPSHAGATDVGRVRAVNEDYVLCAPEHDVFVVCDGLGGESHGELASRLGAEAFRAYVAKGFAKAQGRIAQLPAPLGLDDAVALEERLLAQAVRHANDLVVAESRRRGAPMGSTLVGCLTSFDVEDTPRLSIAHAGDSRCYRLRGRVLERLTRDHSMLEEFCAAHGLEPEDVEAYEDFPYEHMVTRALGQQAPLQPDVSTWASLPGDLYLLCSDGLTGELDDQTIADLMFAHRGALEQGAAALVEAACDAGGHDNVSVVLVRDARPDGCDPPARRLAAS